MCFYFFLSIWGMDVSVSSCANPFTNMHVKHHYALTQIYKVIYATYFPPKSEDNFWQLTCNWKSRVNPATVLKHVKVWGPIWHSHIIDEMWNSFALTLETIHLFILLNNIHGETWHSDWVSLPVEQYLLPEETIPVFNVVHVAGEGNSLVSWVDHNGFMSQLFFFASVKSIGELCGVWLYKPNMLKSLYMSCKSMVYWKTSKYLDTPLSKLAEFPDPIHLPN